MGSAAPRPPPPPRYSSPAAYQPPAGPQLNQGYLSAVTQGAGQPGPAPAAPQAAPAMPFQTLSGQPATQGQLNKFYQGRPELQAQMQSAMARPQQPMGQPMQGQGVPSPMSFYQAPQQAQAQQRGQPGANFSPYGMMRGLVGHGMAPPGKGGKK